jgi:hypothetical protein
MPKKLQSKHLKLLPYKELWVQTLDGAPRPSGRDFEAELAHFRRVVLAQSKSPVPKDFDFEEAYLNYRNSCSSFKTYSIRVIGGEEEC